MGYAIYIEGEKLDTFKDENAILISSVQNINDISKVFTDYSYSISVPASKTNNKIFKHFADADIDGGFDHRTLKSSFIELDTEHFKDGKIRLESVEVVDNKPTTYQLSFFGLLVVLDEEFKDDYISDLDFSAYDHFYSPANVETGLTTGLFSQDIIYPLFSFVKRWYYSSDTADDTNLENIVNIAYEVATDKGIKWDELKPAIKVMRIVEAIETKYGINISRHFIGNQAFDDLYMLVSNEKGYMVNVGADSLIDWTSKTTGTEDYIDLVTDVFSGTIGNIGNFVETYFKVQLTVTPDAGFTTVPYDIKIENSLTGDKIFEVQNVTGTYVSTASIKTSQIQENIEVKFYTSTNTAFDYTSSVVIENREAFLIFGTDTLTDSSTFASSSVSVSSEFSINNFLPSLKVSDFINGIIKWYNLAVIPISDTELYAHTLDKWYSSGTIHDVTKYIDNSNGIKISRGKILSDIKFIYQEAKTFLSLNFLTQNNADYGNAELLLEDSDGRLLDGDSLEIEVPFEQMIYERLRDSNTASDNTDIQYGFVADKDQQPEDLKAHLFYAINQSVTGDTFALLDDVGTPTEITTAFMPFHGNTQTDPNYTTLFNAEINEWDGVALLKSLYSRYYSDYISDAFSVKRRNFPYKGILPSWLISKIKLNDRLVINERRFLINEMETNLLTKEVRFDLINDIFDAAFDPEEIPPSIPQNLYADTITGTSLKLHWDSSIDTGGVGGYIIYQDSVLFLDVGNVTTYIITGLTPSSSSSWTVSSYDTVTPTANESEESIPLVVVQIATDGTVPSDVSGLVATALGETSFTLNWDAATDNVSVAGYKIYDDLGTELYDIGGKFLYKEITGLTASTSYTYKMKAYDTSGNESALFSGNLVVTTTASGFTVFSINLENSRSTTSCVGSYSSPTVYYVDRSTTDPTVGDVIYTDSLGTTPLNGGNNYWWNSATRMIKINTIGEVTTIEFCT